MATVTLHKCPKGMQAAQPKKAVKGDAPLSNYVLQTTEDGQVSVFGTDGSKDANGNPNPIDIKDVATLTVTSSDPAIVGVSSPTGMTFKESGLAVGHADVTIVATWNDGSVGPFTILDPIDVTAPPPPPPAPITGLLLTHGTPTIR